MPVFRMLGDLFYFKQCYVLDLQRTQNAKDITSGRNYYYFYFTLTYHYRSIVQNKNKIGGVYFLKLV